VSIAANRRSITATGINGVTCWFELSDRPEKLPPADRQPKSSRHEKRIIMKKFGFASVIATGFAAVVLGLAGPAAADSTHHEWIHDIQQQASVGTVTSIVGNGR
jgi:hypothetical protein